jgi:ubiquinone/menaquinone biosynthesis C-methylase UbiE
VKLDEYHLIAAVQDGHWWYRSMRALLQQELLPVVPHGGRFLDAGGASGATGGWLAGHGRLVVSDVELLGLSYLARTVPGVSGVGADIAAQPFPGNTFDVVLCITVLNQEAVTDPPAAVRELARVTRPGGVVCVLEPGVRRLHRAHDRQVHTARRFALTDIRNLLTWAGLDVVRATGAFSFLVPPAAVKSVVERREAASDLETGQGRLGQALAATATAERALLRRVALPAGLSVMAIGRKPSPEQG